MALGGGFFSCLPAFSKLFTTSIYYIYNLKNTEQCKENKEFIYNALALLPLSQLDTEIHSPLGFYTPVFKSPGSRDNGHQTEVRARRVSGGGSFWNPASHSNTGGPGKGACLCVPTLSQGRCMGAQGWRWGACVHLLNPCASRPTRRHPKGPLTS